MEGYGSDGRKKEAIPMQVMQPVLSTLDVITTPVLYIAAFVFPVVYSAELVYRSFKILTM